jgi:hypothetical protein
MKKYFYYAMAAIFFVISFIISYWIQINYLKVNVVLYSAFSIVLLSSVLTAALIYWYKKFQIFSGFEKKLMIFTFFLGGCLFAISVPTVIDRSLSFYILEKLQQRGGGIRLESFADVFKEEYLKEHRLVDVRLTEQTESGTIVIRNGCVLLTDKGELLATFSRYFRQNWLPKRRLLLGSYSDTLTDPFRTSPAVEDYKCN